MYIGGYVNNDETNAKLLGRERWQTAADILRNISVVGASVQFMTNLVSRPAWTFQPAEEDSREAQEYADLMTDIIYGMDTSWTRIVRRATMYRFHGFGVHEWVTEKRKADGIVVFKNLYSRHVKTITKWDLDDNGEILGCFQTNPNTGREHYLPRTKLLYLVSDAMSDSPEGMGWFRHLVDPAEALKSLLKLERIGYERDLRGIPVGRAPITRINQKVQEGKLTQQQADEMINGLKDFAGMQRKTHETGLILDSMPYLSETDSGKSVASVQEWAIDLITGEAGSLEELDRAIKRLQGECALIMGTEVLLTGRDGEGSRALSEDKSRNLYLSANAITADMAEATDRDLVDVIWTMNGFPDEMKPTAQVEDVSFKDAKIMAETLADMAGSGAILAPDDPAFNEIRELMGLPPAPPLDEELMRAQMGLGSPEGSGGGDPEDGGKLEDGNEEKPEGAEIAVPLNEDWKDGVTEKFDPNQPRHSAGSKMGGQWSGGNGKGPNDDSGQPSQSGDGTQGDDAREDRESEKDAQRRAFAEERSDRSLDGRVWAYETGSGTSPEGFRGLEATYKPSAEMQALTERSGLNAPVMHEVTPSSDNARAYEGAIQSAKSASRFGAAVYVYPASEYENMRMFVSSDGKSGMAIKSDGDIVSAFSSGGGQVHAMLSLAVEQGGTKLDAFDTVLPKLYAVNGFREVGRDKWDDKYKPDDWDYKTFGKFNGGRPDVVYMEYDPDYNPFEGTEKRWNPSQPRAPKGTSIGGRWIATEGGATRAGVKPMTEDAQADIIEGQKGHTLEELHELAIENQKRLKELGEAIDRDIDGVEFGLPPGPNNGVKKLEGARDKLARKGYDTPENLTDLSRAMFILDRKGASGDILESLQKSGAEVFDEGWKTDSASGYRDRKAMLRWDNGAVSEIQFISRPMHFQKFKNGGHDLYELVRRPDAPRGQAKLFMMVMKAKYDSARAEFGDPE